MRSPFGTLDISDTVDSELVNTALEFGYAGLAVLALIVVLVIRRLRADRWWTHMAALITAAGVYLSLHSWLSLLSLWAIILGAADREPAIAIEWQPHTGGLAAKLPSGRPRFGRTHGERDTDTSSYLIAAQTVLQLWAGP